ncbi:HD domain-containing phosphohydrolase [Shewanella waksmanii]|uniref:HD domain-containing phosphohydrolase n=1 Tax=Shewanella waksmanii TaxID=213783 RepID=UPI003734FAA8
MLRQKFNQFLTTKELPSSLAVAWAVVDEQLVVKQLSEAFYHAVNKPISQILNHHLHRCYSNVSEVDISLPSDGCRAFHWVNDSGIGVQGVFTPYDADNHLWCVSVTEMDLDERWLMELHPDYDHAVQSSDEWLEQIEAVITSSPDEVFNVAVNQALALTDSQVGYLHLYDDKQDQITLTAWSDSALKTCQIPDMVHGPLSDAGIWADSIRTKEAVIHNDSATALNRTGLPEGHFQLTSHMSVPIRYRNHIVGVIGVGNRVKPYTAVDAKSLIIFASILWHCVELPKSMRVLTKQSAVIRSQREKLAHTLVQLIGAVSDAVELKDAYTAGHQKSVAQIAYLIGERLGLDKDRLEGLKLGALIHDIGKLAVPSQILTKPARLTAEEYALVKMHPQQGADVIDEVEFPWPIKEMILQHHERLDGSGYPYGLKGDDILLEAKIIGVADVADSVLSHRPYRASLGMAKLVEILNQGKGSLFDTGIVDICIELLSSHQVDNITRVSHLNLAPVIAVELDDSLCIAREQMTAAGVKVAVVLSETHRDVVGVIDNNLLDLWHSPLLDTAAERTIDRNIENRRVHQVMHHDYPSIEPSMIVKDAAHLLDEKAVDYLLVQEGDNVLGCLTWKILANAHVQFDDSDMPH